MYVVRFVCPKCGNSIENRLHVKVAIQSWCTRREGHREAVRMIEKPVSNHSERVSDHSASEN